MNCEEIYGGGNGGKQYCCTGKDGELRFLQEQTGSSIGAIEMLTHFHNIIEEEIQ